MAEEGKSLLYRIKPFADKLPAIKKPEGHVHFKTKMIWTVLILVIYFALTNVMLYGLDQAKILDVFSSFRAIMAGESGSLVHLGIGPIVTGSIIMQLFTGAKIMKLDLSKTEDKAVYQSTQKLMVIAMIIVESVPQVYGMLAPSQNLIAQIGQNYANLIIIIQLCFGSYLIFLMDEVVSKWGIGSGISLFIAAGVCNAIITGTVNWAPSNPSIPLTVGSQTTNPNLPTGTIPKTIYVIQNMPAGELSQRGYELMLLGQPNPIIALVGTIVIVIIVTYAESARIELPLAHGRVRGARGRYPIRLIYASNIPVILMSALLANVNMFSLLFWSHPTLSKLPLIGHQWWIGGYEVGQTVPSTGGAWYVERVKGVHEWLLPLLAPDRYPPETLLQGHHYWQVFARVIVYVSVMTIGSIFFAKFWIETTNMGAEAVANQIQDSGMQIPGFRRDPRVLRKILERYIPAVTVLSGAFVGLLASGADMIGTVGNTSGTGVLLMVGIIIRMYEQIGKEQMIEMHPVLRGFFGEG